MNRLKRELSLLSAVALSTYKEWAAYKSHMALTMVLSPLAIAVQYFIWKSVYATRGTLGGLSFTQMVNYFVVSTIVGLITFDFAEWNLQMLIRSGKLTTFLLRPIYHMKFAFYQKLGHRTLSLWIEVIPVALICVFVLRVVPHTTHLLASALSVALSFCISFLVNYSIGILSFWFINNSGLRMAFSLLSSISAGAYFPLVLFPKAVQEILLFLPFQYMTYVPTRVFLGSYQLGGLSLPIPALIGVQAIVLVAVFVLSRLLWHFGSRHFMGVGV